MGSGGRELEMGHFVTWGDRMGQEVTLADWKWGVDDPGSDTW